MYKGLEYMEWSDIEIIVEGKAQWDNLEAKVTIKLLTYLIEQDGDYSYSIYILNLTQRSGYTTRRISYLRRRLKSPLSKV